MAFIHFTAGLKKYAVALGYVASCTFIYKKKSQLMKVNFPYIVCLTLYKWYLFVNNYMWIFFYNGDLFSLVLLINTFYNSV